jgi:hypothetical protein
MLLRMAQLLDASGQPSTNGRLVDAYGNVLLPDQPGHADFALPHQFTFSSIIQGASKSWIALGFDEAMRHNRENALAMRRDCRIMGWLRERKEGTVSRKWHLEIDDETDPVQVAVRDGMDRIIRSIPRLKRIFRWCLEAIWYGRYGVQLRWHELDMDLPTVPAPQLFPMGNDKQTALQKHLAAGGELRQGPDGESVEAKPMTARRKVTTVAASRPVNGDKINFGWDGTPMIGIYAAYEGKLRADGADVQRTGDKLKTVISWDNEKPVLLLNREWRERFLIHTYDPDDADYFEAEKAGGVFGVGERSRIYWLNWIRMDYAAWIQDLFDRVGLGFIVIKYSAGNDKAKAAAEDLAKRWNRKSVIAVPVTEDQVQRAGGVEVVDVPTAGAMVVQQLIEYADKHIERRMLGQSMSSGESGREGMGGTAGPAEMAQTTKHQLLQSDAEELEETLTGSDEEPGLCSTIQKWTYPGTIDKFRVRFRFMVEDPGHVVEKKIDAVVALAGAGVEFSQDSVRKLTGEPAPKEGEKTFGGAQAAPGMPGQPPTGEEPDAGDGGDGQDDDQAGDQADAGDGGDGWDGSIEAPDQ